MKYHSIYSDFFFIGTVNLSGRKLLKEAKRGIFEVLTSSKVRDPYYATKEHKR